MVDLGVQMMINEKLKSKRIWFMHTINVVVTRLHQYHYAEQFDEDKELFQLGILTDDEEFWPYWMIHMVELYEKLQGAQV